MSETHDGLSQQLADFKRQANDKLLSIIESARKAGVPADVILNSLIAKLLEADDAKK